MQLITIYGGERGFYHISLNDDFVAAQAMVKDIVSTTPDCPSDFALHWFVVPSHFGVNGSIRHEFFMDGNPDVYGDVRELSNTDYLFMIGAMIEENSRPMQFV